MSFILNPPAWNAVQYDGTNASAIGTAVNAAGGDIATIYELADGRLIVERLGEIEATISPTQWLMTLATPHGSGVALLPPSARIWVTDDDSGAPVGWSAA